MNSTERLVEIRNCSLFVAVRFPLAVLSHSGIRIEKEAAALKIKVVWDTIMHQNSLSPTLPLAAAGGPLHVGFDWLCTRTIRLFPLPRIVSLQNSKIAL